MREIDENMFSEQRVHVQLLPIAAIGKQSKHFMKQFQISMLYFSLHSS